MEFSTEDGTRSDLDFLIKVVEVAIQAGATTINIPDTVGYTTPAEYTQLFRTVRERVAGSENIIYSTHCHDDLGMAVANSLAGIEGGARQVECTIIGIGERAGNAALEEIAAVLATRHDRYPYTSNIVMDQLYPTSKMLGEIISFQCSPNKAVVGKNAFSHESGIHQHGVLANPLTYEIMDARVGRLLHRAEHRPRQTLRPQSTGTSFERTRTLSDQTRTRRGLHPFHRTSRPQKIHLRPGHCCAAARQRKRRSRHRSHNF